MARDKCRDHTSYMPPDSSYVIYKALATRFPGHIFAARRKICKSFAAGYRLLASSQTLFLSYLLSPSRAHIILATAAHVKPELD